MHWDGATWNEVDAPNNGLPQEASQHWSGEIWNNLVKQTPELPDGPLYSDVQELPSGDIWAVGGYNGGMGSSDGYALAAHYSSTHTSKQCP